jgi:phage regulator Rha-like protein
LAEFLVNSGYSTSVHCCNRAKPAGFFTSLVLAEQLGIQHKNVITLIEKHADNLGPFAFQTRKGKKLPQGGFAKSTRVALLTHDQAIFLLTVAKNSPRALEIKANIASAFVRFSGYQQAAANYLPVYSSLQDALKALAEYSNPQRAGVTQGVLSMNYNGLINKACGIAGGKRLGMNAESRAQLAHITGIVTTAITDGMLEGIEQREIFRRVRALLEPFILKTADAALTFATIEGGVL